VSFTYSIEIISIKNVAAHVYIGEYIGYIGLCGVVVLTSSTGVGK